MAERDDRMAQDVRDAQRSDRVEKPGSDRAAKDGTARNADRPHLAGDIESNRNLSGSTTYETLSEEGDLDVASGGSDSARDSGKDSGKQTR